MRHLFSKIFCTTCLFLALVTHAVAQTEVSSYKPGVTVDGVTYFLPKTAIRVVLTAEKTVVHPGEFNKYAFKYMHMQDVPTEVSTHYSIKNIELQPYGVPDKAKCYSIRLKGRTVAPLVSLSQDGLLLAINADVTEENLPELPHGEPAGTTENPRKYMNQEMLQAGSAAKMAELVAQQIYDLRESRNDLIKGEAENTPKDGQQLQLMLNSIDEQDAALESMFKGSRETGTEVYTFNIIPAEQTEKLMLLRFSEKLGPLATDDLAGSPVYISIRCEDEQPQTTPDTKTAAQKAKMQMGVYYNVPVNTEVKVFTPQKEYASTTIPMGQFGKTEVLSNTLFDKKTTTQVTFFKSTGAVKDVVE